MQRAALRAAVISSHVTIDNTNNNNNDNNNKEMLSPICVVVGSGPGIGYSIARTFFKAGFSVVLSRRSARQLEQDVAHLSSTLQSDSIRKCQVIKGYACDARKEAEVQGLFSKIEAELSLTRLKVVVFNVGANVPCSILDETERKFRKIWEMACFGGFLVGREAARVMLSNITAAQEKEDGGENSVTDGSELCETIIFTGASASLRGRANFTAFGSAKAALRSVAQSMARELGPRGIHVAHIVIDGPIDNPITRQFFGDRMSDLQPHQFVQPDAIASNYLHIAQQPQNAWTHELDLRTHTESW